METKEVKTTTIYHGQDSEGNSAALVTPEAAVFDEKGICLKDKLADIDPKALRSLYETQLAGIEEAGNMELENLKTSQSLFELSFNTDRFTTRKSIPSQKRHKGMIISYMEYNMPILECYVGDTVGDGDNTNGDELFANDTNWQLLNTSPQIISQIGASVSGTKLADLKAYHTIIYMGSSKSPNENLSYTITDDDTNLPTFKNKAARDGTTIEIYTLPQSEPSTLVVNHRVSDKPSGNHHYHCHIPADCIGHMKLVWLNELNGFFVTRTTYESIDQ